MMRHDSVETLKLIALDAEDLKIVSANLQDAIVKMGDMTYLPSERRFAAVLSRFDWLAAEDDRIDRQLRRCRCALRFDRVKRAQLMKLDPSQPSAVAELLALTYEETDPPSGIVTLYFAGGSAIRLEVECIEAELRDLGGVWQTAVKPAHPFDGPCLAPKKQLNLNS